MTEVPDGSPAPGRPPAGEVPGRSPTDLLLAAGRGDRQAFAALYERFARPLMAFLHALTRDRAQAEDLVQETFVRAWRAAPRWEPRAAPSTWLFTIARHLAWSARPSAPRAGPRPARPAAAPPSAPDAELGRQLAEAVAALSPPLREAFVLVRLHGLPLAEVATIVSAPLGTVKSRLAAAEAALRRHLARWAPEGRTP